MQPLYDIPVRHTHGADEEGGALVDDDVDQLVQSAVRVIVVRGAGGGREGGEGEVDAEGEGAGEGGFEGVDHGAELWGRVAQAADDTETAGEGDGGGEGCGRGVGHAGEEDGVGD